MPLVWFQFTRPCGHDSTRDALPVCCFVSIHAPAWGATHGELVTVVRTDVSIHAPVRARLQRPARFASRTVFQLTRPWEGRDRRTMSSDWCRTFQFTRPVGARHMTSRKPSSPPSFQFTRPVGARRAASIGWGYIRFKFQFARSRGARLGTFAPEVGVLRISIRAPEGAT